MFNTMERDYPNVSTAQTLHFLPFFLLPKRKNLGGKLHHYRLNLQDTVKQHAIMHLSWDIFTPPPKKLRTLLCTRQFSAGHNTIQYHVSRLDLSTAMHILYATNLKKRKRKKSLPFHIFKYQAAIISVETIPPLFITSFQSKTHQTLL